MDTAKKSILQILDVYLWGNNGFMYMYN